MKEFFVNYTKEDEGWAEWVAWQLEEKGYRIHIQKWDNLSGENFIAKIDDALEKNIQSILILSSNSKKSKFVKAEWTSRLAIDPIGKNRKLIPIKVDDSPVEGILNTIGYIDLVGLTENEANLKLLKEIEGNRKKPSKPPTFPKIKFKKKGENIPKYPGANYRIGTKKICLVYGKITKQNSLFSLVYNSFQKEEDSFTIEDWVVNDQENSFPVSLKDMANEFVAFVVIINKQSQWSVIKNITNTINSNRKQYNNIYVFVDEKFQTPPKDHLLNDKNIISFSKNELSSFERNILYIIEQLKKELEDFIITKTICKVRITPNFTGFIDYNYQLVATDKSNILLNYLKGRFFITKDVIKRNKTNIPTLLEMTKKGIDPYTAPTFSSKIVLNNGGNNLFVDKIEESKHDGESTSKKFKVIFNRPLMIGEDVNWIWGISYPKLFRKRGKGNASFTARQDIESFQFKISFEIKIDKLISFIEQPLLIHEDENGNEKLKPRYTSPEENLYNIDYVWKNIQNVKKGDSLKIKWIIK